MKKGNIEGKMATRLDKAISVCLDSVLDQMVLCGRDVCFDMQAVSKSQKITDVIRLRSSQALI